MIEAMNPTVEPATIRKQKDELFYCEECLPSLVERRALSHPTDLCIISSTENFDYSTLWNLVLVNAERFSNLGIDQTSRIAIISDSSPMAVIALFATMKVGAMAVPLSSPVPAERYRSIARTSGITHLLDLGATKETALCNVEVQTLDSKPTMRGAGSESEALPPGPHTPAVALFTSGSSGQPKGVVHSHASLSTMAVVVAQALGLHPGERNFLFASFGWGLNTVETLATLTAGACLCIPSSAEKSQGLEQVINTLRATRTSLSGSMLANLDPRLVPSLKNIVIGGESARRNVIAQWAPHATLRWNFGSSETWMILCGDAADCSNGGYALPSCWCSVTSADGVEVVEGEVGELVVEGHENFMGYLNAGLIIAAPRGPRGCSVVRTGDLFERSKKLPGLLIYRGRADSQIKLHGQRLAPEEVESQLWVALEHVRELVVTMAKLQGSHRSPGLVAVIVPARAEWTCRFEILTRALPPYMIPIGALVVDRSTLPRLPNGKLDRNGVRALSEQRRLEHLVDLRHRSLSPPSSPSPPSPPAALIQTVREVWITVLDVPQHVIASSSSFFLLGGDSLDAMRACKEFWKRGVRVTLAAFFTHPTLDGMATLLDTQMLSMASHGDIAQPIGQRQGQDGSASAFTAALSTAAQECHIPEDMVEKLYPCTSLQAGIMSMSALQHGTYVAEGTFRLPRAWTKQSVVHCWHAVVKATPILRTRIVQLANGELWNVALRFNESAALPVPSVGCLQDAEFGSLGTPLFLHSLDEDSETQILTWTWRIHHAILDRWSMTLLLDMVAREHTRPGTVHSYPFSDFAAAVAQQEQSSSARSFWKCKLDSFEGTPFPELPRGHERSRSSGHSSFEVNIERQRSNTTQATSIQVAVALLIARMTGETDVLFGMTVHGRDLPDCPNADLVVGPAIATVPVRIKLDFSVQAQELLEQIQKDTAQMLEHQHLGLQNITSIAPHLEFASKFQTLLIVQQDYDFESKDDHEKVLELCNGPNDFDLNYPLVLECFPHHTGVKVNILYDQSVLSAWQVQTLSREFGQLLTALESPAASKTRVRDLNLLDSQSLSHVLRVSRGHVFELHECLHDRIFDRAQGWLAEDALDGWDARYTYAELGHLVRRMTMRLSSVLGKSPGEIVPICYPKSAACVIVMLAVLSAGHGFLMLDPSLPKQRVQYMVEAVGADCILCSNQTRSIADQISVPSFVLDTQPIGKYEGTSDGLTVRASPEMPAYCMFTSGSTGLPKGVLLLHKQVTSGLQAQCDLGLFSQKTRVFQFSSYAFDTCIADIFATLLAGGCVCIPREEHKLDRLSEYINDFKANLVDLTPSVAELLRPEDTPTLSVFRFGGEPVQQHHLDQWIGCCSVQNVYGPTECCVQCTYVDYVAGMSPSVIGNGINCNTWVVDPHNHNFLMPAGAIGELAIQGPAVASGYINNPEATLSSFTARAPFLDTYTISCEYPTYFTGDMVKYDEQGQLVFVGRRDNQIKIRGQRVQLEEVEHVLQRGNVACHAVVCYPLIGALASELVAVIGRFQSQPPSRSTCGMAHSDNHLFASRVRRCAEKAKQVLPMHMVPSVYLSTDRPLLLSSGKLDRRSIQKWVEQLTEAELNSSTVYRLEDDTITNLDLTEVVTKAQMVPVLEQVKLLTSRKAGQPKRSASDTQPFSRIGLDSITLVAFLRWINKRYGPCMDMQTLLGLGTVRRLVSHLHRSVESGGPVTKPLGTRSVLRNVVESGVERLCGPDEQSGHLGNVVLTGATSLVGTSLIVELLSQMPEVSITAIVRCTDAILGKNRLLQRLQLLRRWTAEFTSRVTVWPGDLSRPRLGLSSSHWSHLGQQSFGTLAIVHAGAAVDWVGDLEALQKVNVDATLDLVEHATHSDGVKRLIYLSGGPQWDPDVPKDEVLEGDGLGKAFEVSNAYGQTKNVAGAVIQRSAVRNARVAAKVVMIRPAVIIGSSHDGVPNMDDFIWRVILACYTMTAYPAEPKSNWLYLVGADFIANVVIRKISSQPQVLESRIEEGLPVEEFWAVVNQELGGRLQRLDYDTWLKRLQQDVEAQGGDGETSHPCLPILHMLEASSNVLGARPPPCVSQGWKQRTTKECIEAVRSNVRYMVDIGCFTNSGSTWSARVFNRRKQA